MAEKRGSSVNSPDWLITDFDGNPFPMEKLPFAQVISSGSPVYGICHTITTPDGRCDLQLAPNTVRRYIDSLESLSPGIRFESELYFPLSSALFGGLQLNSLP
jgi:hypothetical protein